LHGRHLAEPTVGNGVVETDDEGQQVASLLA